MPSEGSNIPTAEEVERSKVFVNFINILFAIVLGQSFVLITSSNQQGGFKELFMNPVANFAPISTLFLSYTLVITSFVGYNSSIKEFPIRYPWRFVIDIIILFTYFALFTATTNFGLVLLLYSVIFFLYFLWNVFRFVEYRSLVDIKGQLLWRTIHCFIFFAVFIIALIVFNTFRSEFIAGMITTLALVVFISYRILKRPTRTHKTPVQNENYNDLA